jgi:hypothetical protein
MKILIEIDTETKESKVIERINLSEKDLCDIISSYFGLTMESLNSKPLLRDGQYSMCRQFITFFLMTELGLINKEISDILSYDSSSGIISHNIKTIQKNLNEESILTTKGIMGKYTRSYNNLVKIINRYNTKNEQNL